MDRNGQFTLFYVKGGILYPVILEDEQKDMLPLILNALGTIKVASNMPQGEVRKIGDGKQ